MRSPARIAGILALFTGGCGTPTGPSAMLSQVSLASTSVVAGASSEGTWVRILHPPIEGKLVSGFKGVDVGHRLNVQLIHTDVERGYIDFKSVG